MSFLTLTDVSKFYGPNCVVANMNLSVEKGEFVTLLGPSGCGKTTTLQMIAGFTEVSQGSITLDGRDITSTPPNSRGLGIVFQSYALFPHMTVFENVSFGLEMRRLDKAQRLERVSAALALVHLEDLAARYPRELSGGQKQRVALARALVIEPPVLLLDEPLSNLDAKLREEMQFELRQIQRKVGTTTIMVTHDQTEAMSICDRVVVMQAGHVTQVDVPYQLYENPQSKFISTFVGKANLMRAQQVHGGGAGAAVTSLSVNGVPFQCKAAELSSSTELMVSLRPEKISFVPLGQGQVDGRVSARFFLGSQWLYQVDTPMGVLQVACPNNDTAPLNEQDPTGLQWSPDSARVLS
ncbi:MAG: ABC transporter ATP-binding protein [Betaproteobacteria bacterium]|nr:ABC transporter ATP-binding protein [Betaproteobacteria bacterium]NBX89630.1 ABC transporter ATP-binding protein [Betaproteobacteria bacterium]